VRFPSRSIEACLSQAGLSPGAIDVVAVSTFDVAKTVGRWWPGSKERYYAVRRRQRAPGFSARLTRSLKYLLTELPPNVLSASLSRLGDVSPANDGI